jgi:hypothetical protein
MIGLRRINKSSRLAVVDGFQKGAVQEHILHIELMNRPGAGDGETARESTVWTVSGLTIRLKVSS